MEQKTKKQRFREIETAVRQGKTLSIINLCEDYMKDYPKQIVIWLYLADALADFSNYKKANSLFLKAIKALKKLEATEYLNMPYQGLGELYERKGNYRKAIEWYGKASDIMPEEATYPIFIGVLYYRLGNFAEAENHLEKASKCKEGHIEEANYNLALVLASQKRYEEAFVKLKKAIEIDSRYKEAKFVIKDIEKVLESLPSKNR